ncbi:hypothetical protein NKI74_33845 [Mesorhizobium sp. M0494]|uniref:hypothetical protein n=1 Tax=Mesorhizobium sp. M0494 TaxID=2956951 RepID=UPI00333B0534
MECHTHRCHLYLCGFVNAEPEIARDPVPSYHTDLANSAFPFATSQEIDVRYARVIAARRTFIGELGWELHIPTEMAQHVFDVIWEAGQEYGLKAAGYHALNIYDANAPIGNTNSISRQSIRCLRQV